MSSSVPANANFLAVDLGASGGRVMWGRWDGQEFELQELHRFPNIPITIEGHLHWNIEALWAEIKKGIALYPTQTDEPLTSIEVDTWAVDYGFLMIPDIFHYNLCGSRPTDYTNATTTQFFSAKEKRWATGLLAQLGIPNTFLPPIVHPGTIPGKLLPELTLKQYLPTEENESWTEPLRQIKKFSS